MEVPKEKADQGRWSLQRKETQQQAQGRKPTASVDLIAAGRDSTCQ